MVSRNDLSIVGGERDIDMIMNGAIEANDHFQTWDYWKSILHPERWKLCMKIKKNGLF